MTRAARLLARAASRHRAGSSGEAARLYQSALDAEPGNPDALHGLGCLALEDSRPEVAIGLIGQAVAARPEVAHYMISLGLALLGRGHSEEARAALQVAVLREPDDPRAHRALAQALSRLGRADEARASLLTAIRLDPSHPGAHLALGAQYRAEGDHPGAIAAFNEATRLAPSDPLAWHSLAAQHGLAGEAGEAEAAFRRVAELLPDDAAAQANFGTALFTLGRLEAAQNVLIGARRQAPDNPATQSSLGLVLMGLGETIEAEAMLARAAGLAPLSDAIAVNHGTALAALERRAEAEAVFRSVLRRAPGNAHARFNLSTTLLARGALAEGWEAFEARLALVPQTATMLPAWDGAALAAGSVLVRAEQGLGDTIQFLRWIPQAAMRARLVLDLPPAVRRLAGRLGFDAGRVRISNGGRMGSATPAADCVAWVSLLSLPHLLHCPDVPPLLPSRLAGTGTSDERALRVGLAWAGSPAYQFDRLRTIRLAQLAPLAATGAEFVSLQAGEAAAQPAPAGMRLAMPAPPADLADTAELIAGLDLVISVDTVVAHLAGMLGRPVWLLDRLGGDWRWGPGFAAGRSWYPKLVRFAPERPMAPADGWAASIAQVAERLCREAGARCRRGARPISGGAGHAQGRADGGADGGDTARGRTP